MPARLPGNRLTLAVFSFEEEARMFLTLSDLPFARRAERGWWIQSSGPVELASILLAQDERVAWVTLDPLTVAGAEPMNVLASMGRAEFLGFLLKNQAGSQLDASWAAF